MGRFEATPRSRPVGVGEHAPDFTLRHTFTESLSLAERLTAGPVVLVFYVFDFGHY